MRENVRVEKTLAPLYGIIIPMLERIWRAVTVIVFVVLGSALLTRSTLPPSDKVEQVRTFTRTIEFDYLTWILNALNLKTAQWALGTGRYLPESEYYDLALEYMSLVGEISNAEAELNEFFTDPSIPDPMTASAAVRSRLDALYERQERLAPLAESIIQGQITWVAAEMGLTLAGQPVPPVLYHSTPLPLALIVSPRAVIQQDAHISLLPDLPVDQRAQLEEQVDQSLNVSSLVVPVGGVGVYPTMVYQTNNVNWLAETVAHEWIHNYLTLRPLGISYLKSPELGTMNETAASIAGREIGERMIELFYPELVPPPPPEPSETGSSPPEAAEPPAFSFRSEMRDTRLMVNQLLSEGKIEEAEAYMEERRLYFYENGYHIRKLNQAYFAFYGSYADEPGGAAGDDPVGAAVRALRKQSASLAQFLNSIAWMSSFEELQEAVSRADL